MEKIAYGGWENCIRLGNGRVELVITTDVGPRIIRAGFIGGQNLLKEYADQLGGTADKEWMIRGGHHLWHAPEAKPRTVLSGQRPGPVGLGRHDLLILRRTPAPRRRRSWVC